MSIAPISRALIPYQGTPPVASVRHIGDSPRPVIQLEIVSSESVPAPAAPQTPTQPRPTMPFARATLIASGYGAAIALACMDGSGTNLFLKLTAMGIATAVTVMWASQSLKNKPETPVIRSGQQPGHVPPCYQPNGLPCQPSEHGPRPQMKI